MFNLNESADAIFDVKPEDLVIWDGLTYICDIQIDGSKIGFSRYDEAWMEERRIDTGQYRDAHRHLRLDDGRAVGTRSEFYVAMILNQLRGNA